MRQRKETPWSSTKAVPTSPGVLFPMFTGVSLRNTVDAPNGFYGVRMVVQVIPQANGNLQIGVAISDGMTSPAIFDDAFAVTAGQTLVYEMRWGSHETVLTTPSGGGAVYMLGGSIPSQPQMGLRADLNVGGHPDGSGTISGQLFIKSTGFTTLACTSSATLLVWGE